MQIQSLSSLGEYKLAFLLLIVNFPLPVLRICKDGFDFKGAEIAVSE